MLINEGCFFLGVGYLVGFGYFFCYIICFLICRLEIVDWFVFLVYGYLLERLIYWFGFFNVFMFIICEKFVFFFWLLL